MIIRKNNEDNLEYTNVKAVEKIIGYSFNDKKLLQRAITHSSYNVLKGTVGESYQRME